MYGVNQLKNGLKNYLLNYKKLVKWHFFLENNKICILLITSFWKIKIDKLKLKAFFSIKLSTLNTKIEIISKKIIFDRFLINKNSWLAFNSFFEYLLFILKWFSSLIIIR